MNHFVSDDFKKGNVRIWLLCMLFMAFFQSFAQNKVNTLHINGRIRIDNGDPTGAVVTLSNLKTKADEASSKVGNGGKFDFDLNYFSEYRLTVSKEDHYTKEIDISTVIPSKVWAKDSIFPPFLMVVTIYKSPICDPKLRR
ncbi:MAG: hypothetical protein LWW85_11065 [Marinilabiliales bacterium]|nr:hypothetical protein [Marinilabiliales bacterium]